MQRHAQSPQRGAFNLGLGAVRMNDSAGVDDKSQLLDGDAAACAIDPHTGDAGDPGGHVAFLAKARGNAKPGIFRRRAAPGGSLSDAGEHRGLPPRAADSVGRRSGIAPGAIQQTQPERHRINPCGVGSLVHEAFHRPVGPARPDRAQPTGPEGSVGEIIGQRANPLRSHRVPVIGAAYREGIIQDAVGVL